MLKLVCFSWLNERDILSWHVQPCKALMPEILSSVKALEGIFLAILVFAVSKFMQILMS